MKEHVLAIDIGNTNINLGMFEGSKLLRTGKIATQQAAFTAGLKKFIRNVSLDKAIVCSVVPAATRKLVRDLKKTGCMTPCVLGEQIKVPVENKYKKPSQVGQDRLVNGFAGICIYGAPVVVVDFGTAVTFDVVSRRHEYKGGLILPGLKISLEALAKKTALLPQIKLTYPKELIGTDTKNSMLSGLVYGFAALTDDLVLRIKKEIGRDAKVIATGGDAALISKYCNNIDAIDTNLTLKGIFLISNTI